MQNSKLKNIIVLSIVVLLILGAVLYQTGTLNGLLDKQELTTNETSNVKKSTSSTSNDDSKTNKQSSSLTVELPPKPVNGTTKGVVEVGASGFNSFVISVDKQGRYEVLDKKFGDSLAYEGMASLEDVKLGLKKYIAQMFNKGVESRNVHFVISSGALKDEKMKLIADGIRASGFFVNEVTAEQEGKWAFMAAMNPLYKDNSFVVDIGSGNTKISWFENNQIKTLEASGAKYFQNGISNDDVFKELKTKASNVPTSKRKYCFLIGGVPFSLAKQTRNKNERYTNLMSLDSYSFSDKKEESGLNILKAIQDETNVEEFIFDWDANFTIGFLMNLK